MQQDKNKNSSTQKNLLHFNDLFSRVNFADEFGWSTQWNEEVEKWLAFIEKKDSGYYKTHRNRAKNAKQRDELLGEYKAGYIIEEICGGKLFSFEPSGSSSYIFDFSFFDLDKDEWFVEVKSPSWRSIVSKEIDDKFFKELRETLTIIGSERYPNCKAEIGCRSCREVFTFEAKNIQDKQTTDEEIKVLVCPKCKKNLWNLSEQERAKEKSARLSLPQHINVEGRWLGFDVFEESIINSVKKFDLGKNNLLLLCPNLFAEMGFFGALENWHHLREMIKRLDPEGKISSVGLLDVSLREGFRYDCSFVTVKNSPSLNDKATIYPGS